MIPRVPFLLFILCVFAVPALADSPLFLRLASPARVAITAGEFVMGADGDQLKEALALCEQAESKPCDSQRFAPEMPAHRVYVSEFEVDLTEVTFDDYGRCRAALACPPSAVSDEDGRFARPDHPVTGVTHAQAAAYCRFVGGRLPTEAEWERAARSRSARRFPWGQYWNSRLANHGPAEADRPIDGYRFTAPVGSYPDGRSAYGLLDMGGNVWEWTADRYGESYYQTSARVNPKGPAEGTGRVIRGGSFRSAPHELRVTARAALAEAEARSDVGFRCAYDAP